MSKDYKRVCDNCRYFHVSQDLTRETCFITTQYTKMIDIITKDYANDRINGNEFTCRFKKKITNL